ncbi:MAG: O-antigen ligase family protein [Chrysiogenia bacterium]
MKFAEWRNWLKKLNWSKRWFVFLILIRPIVDIFYFLKKLSPFLSPLYIVGVLSFLLVVVSLNSKGLRKSNNSLVDKYFVLLILIISCNVILLSFIEFSLNSFGDAIKYLIPFLLFIYLRRFVTSKENLDGLLFTVLLSAIFPITMIVFEIFVGPISTSAISMSRGGGVRYEGGYADIMNYAIYLISSFLILGYFSMDSIKRNVRTYFNKYFILFLPIFLIGLIKIKHTTTWAVAFMAFALYSFYKIFNKRINLPFIFILLFSVVFAQGFIESNIKPLLAKDIRVMEGEAEIDRSFNGRMIRWKNAFLVWNEIPVVSKIFGASTIVLFENLETIKFEKSNKDITAIPKLFGGGTHNEYLRILFLTGFIGLFIYLKILYYFLRKSFHYSKQERFLILGFLLALILYSISTNPFLYQPLIYIFLPVLAYASLPINKK